MSGGGARVRGDTAGGDFNNLCIKKNCLFNIMFKLYRVRNTPIMSILTQLHADLIMQL